MNFILFDKKGDLTKLFNFKIFQPDESEPLIRPNYIPTSSPAGSRGEKSKRKINVKTENDTKVPDPELVSAASNFVTDIIEKAKTEAARRLKFQLQAQVQRKSFLFVKYFFLYNSSNKYFSESAST